MKIFLLFPIHLYSNIDILKNYDMVYLIEDKRFFTDFKYHKLKIAYHRATMKYYYDFLIKNNFKVKYIEYNDKIKYAKNHLYTTYSLGDNVLKNRISKEITKLEIIDSINFLVNETLIKENQNIFYNKDKNKYNFQNFYKWQRIRLQILITKNNKPIGGKWSFDNENRKKLPDNIIPPKIESIDSIKEHKYIKEAIEYTNKHFSKNYGELNENNFIYPITHNDSMEWLKIFLKERFENFGLYEDAVNNKYPFVFHSILSPMMNIGLLTDNEVIHETKKYENKVSIQSYEGFMRQIIGWRNYVYSIYLLEGETLKESNFFKHKNNIDEEKIWYGKTNIKPIDDIMEKIIKYSYFHHIERLMYIGNFLLLCMIEPNQVYKLFMEWTIDTYEWVMVPNVYGMSQHADGGIMMTRPYFCSSNYILKMSNYKKGEWCKILDSLYYNFIDKHQEYLKENYSTAIQVKNWNKKSQKEKNEIKKNAKEYLDEILI